MNLSRRASIGGAVALMAALALPASAQTPASTVRIGYQKGGGLLALMKSQGGVERAFAPTRQSVKWVEFPGGPQMLEALGAGSIDFAATGGPPPIFAQAAGIDVVYVGAEPAPVAGEALIVPAASTITTVAQLKGKKVAFHKGSGSHLLLVSALRKAGLTTRDIQPIYLGPSEARAAFAGGSVDAWVVWDPYLAAAQKAYPVRVLADYTGLLQANGFYLTSRVFLASSAASVATLMEQIRLAGQWVTAHPQEMVKMLAPQVGVAPDVIEIWMKRGKAGAIPVDAAIVANQQKVADLFYQEKLIPRPVTVAGHTWTWVPVKR